MLSFRCKEFITKHIKSILDFYDANVCDHVNGGFHHNFYDDGSLIESDVKHLVSSTRMVFNYSKAHELFGGEYYQAMLKRGLDFIAAAHYDEQRQAYNWVLSGRSAIDQTNYTYGLAFVMLAYSNGIQAGFTAYNKQLTQTWQILEKRFWQPEQELYADEASSDWRELSSYRGQNSNMHACEACIAAYAATGQIHYLNRASLLAKTVVITLADKSDGLIWEHYLCDLTVDWQYNKHDPQNLYKPWGFQPGHLAEWAKLLLNLYEYVPEHWLLERAESLFAAAMDYGWDEKHGGLFYGFAPDKSVCDDDKYFWVQCESFAAAAMLAKVTGKGIYWQWYEKIWHYCWAHFVDHQHGAWFRVLSRDNKRYSNKKSEAGSKCDYHSLGACYTVLKAI